MSAVDLLGGRNMRDFDGLQNMAMNMYDNHVARERQEGAIDEDDTLQARLILRCLLQRLEDGAA